MTEEELTALREKALALLKKKRIPHVLGVEETAAALARRWGEREEDARVAAILHDCTKRLSLEEHLALCERYGLVPDEMERGSADLLHAKTGAALAKYEFGVPDRVAEAICWHTTGKAGMNTLEKIIYLADGIEPNRRFEGLEEIRAAAFENLDRAVALFLRRSLRHMEETGVTTIHPHTLEALRDLEDHIEGT